MCGISGVIKFSDKAINMTLIEAMNKSLFHRGPDGHGSWISEDGKVAFGHRRLSIIDLDKRSAQPFHYKHLSLTYNGEIYNYLELKTELIELGYEFYTSSDTEVVLVSYLAWGQKFLDRLDGMFSLAINDSKENKTFVARDRFGEKPFYYFKNEDEFVFASEIKALATYSSTLTVNKEAISRYLVYDVVENPKDLSETFFRGIKKLPPAHCMLIDEKGIQEITEYWKIDESITYKGDLKSAITKFQHLFGISVKRRLRSDVSLGSSLSGGLDSSSIMAELNQNGGINVNSFTARFDDQALDEGTYVDHLEKRFKFKRNDVWPSSQSLHSELSILFYHQEEPFGSSSIYAQWEVMKEAKEKEVTVLLDGQGADEILGGYEKYVSIRLGELLRKNIFAFFRSFKEANRMPGISVTCIDLIPTISPSLYDKLRNGVLAGRFKKKLINGLGKEIKTTANAINNPFRSFHNLNKALHFDTFHYGLGKLLRFSDKNSMAHSREVRLPFLYHELVEFVFSLPSEMKIKIPWTKFILRKSMVNQLPEEICWRKDKKGYAPPQENWMNSIEMTDLISQSEKGLIDRKVIEDPSVFRNWQILMVAEVYKFAERYTSEN